MAEVLNQQEIDSLLNNVKSGTDKKKKKEIQQEAILFDFRLPNRISKPQLRTLTNIYEIFSENFASYLVSKLQTSVTMKVTSVDQLYYSEYVLSVSNPACLYTFEIQNTDIKGILEFSPELALTLVDLLLGGSGKGKKQSKIITPIEQNVLNVIVEKVMLDLKKAWNTIEKMDFAVERFEPDIDFAQITSPNESVLLISFEVIIGEQNYLMNLCFATFAFDNILAKLNTQKLSTLRPKKYSGTTSRDIIYENLLDAKVPITAEFGNSQISMSELMNLEKNDILRLNSKIGEEIKMKYGKKILFLGRIGTVNDHKAIKISKREFKNEKTE